MGVGRASSLKNGDLNNGVVQGHVWTDEYLLACSCAYRNFKVYLHSPLAKIRHWLPGVFHIELSRNAQHLEKINDGRLRCIQQRRREH